ncbi:MAG: hypothetical protein J6K72_05140 [Clostridia bacterium]|nr:hypothetical protein [Clostridia bacterium]
MEYKKSYLGLVIWLVLFMAIPFVMIVLPPLDGSTMMRLFLNYMAISLALLMLIIHQTEAIYWINGVEFDQAKEAGSEKRKAFAMRHLERFGWFALLFAAFSCLCHILGWSEWIDFAVCVVGIFGVAISTISIKL